MYLAPKHATEWAITIGQTTYYSVPESEVNPSWRLHEDVHKQQWKKKGRIRFAFSYTYYNIFKGYKHNPYEIEARKGLIS